MQNCLKIFNFIEGFYIFLSVFQCETLQKVMFEKAIQQFENKKNKFLYKKLDETYCS